MSSVWKHALKTFLENKDETELRSHLRKEWIDIYPEEKSEIYNFLYRSQQHKLFMYLFAVDLQSQIVDLPWIKTLTLLSKSKISIDEKIFDELIGNLKKQKLLSGTPTSVTELISDLKTKDRQRFLQKMLRTKQELIASARIAQSERLHEKHVFYINELKKISPNEFNVSSLITDREKERAKKILSKSSKKRARHQNQQASPVSLEEKALLEQISVQAEGFLNTKNVKPSDLAFLFRSMGEYTKAIDFIYQTEEEEKKDWQLLDYLFSGKQFVSLLDHCQKLKSKYAEYPDALFSVSYAESVAFWELGEKDKAIFLMSQIASMRPDFKSATETLAQWKEDGFE